MFKNFLTAFAVCFQKIVLMGVLLSIWKISRREKLSLSHYEYAHFPRLQIRTWLDKRFWHHIMYFPSNLAGLNLIELFIFDFYSASKMCGHPESPKTAPLSWRVYRDEIDRDQVKDMCKNVYDGADSVPRIVSLYPKHTNCMPLVGILGNEVVAFCNLRRLLSEDDTQNVVFLECVRILKALRGNGLGTAMTQQAMQSCDAWCDPGKSIRLLSTTIPKNEAMSSVFHKTGWVCIGQVQIWPSDQERVALVEKTNCLRGRYLDALQVSKYIPDYALASVGLWQKLETADQVEDIMRRVQTHGGCLLKPGFYAVQTVNDAAVMAMAEDCSAWSLERESDPPALLFYQSASANWFEPLSADLFSACVADVAAAESCVAFAASLKDIGTFTISFDPSVTKEKMSRSPLLSQCDTNSFLIYEALR